MVSNPLNLAPRANECVVIAHVSKSAGEDGLREMAVLLKIAFIVISASE